MKMGKAKLYPVLVCHLGIITDIKKKHYALISKHHPVTSHYSSKV